MNLQFKLLDSFLINYYNTYYVRSTVAMNYLCPVLTKRRMNCLWGASAGLLKNKSIN